jgi:membrane-bound serine protease (ClpP class)
MKRYFGWSAALTGLILLSVVGGEPQPVPTGNGASERGLLSGVMPGNGNLKKLGLPPNPRVMVIPVNDQESTRYGMIDPWQAKFISRRLEEAEAGKYDLVILEIDTNGGDVFSCQRINWSIADCSVPVIAHVRGTAFSGGAIISHGCRAVVMEPGSTIGGAQAVGLLGDLGKDEREKMRQLLVMTMRALSEKHGYPGPIAQGMVDMGITVYETDDPHHRFMTGFELDDWKKNEITRGMAPNIVSTWKEPDTILTLTSQQAYDCGLASALPADRKALFATLGVTPVEVYENHISGGEKIARFLGNPIFMALLIIVAVIAAIYELKAGGHYIGYFVALLCVILFFWLAFLGDSAGWLELILFITGIVLLGVELFVLPGFGVSGVAGLGFMLLAILTAFIPAGTLSALFQSGPSTNPFQMQLLMGGLTYAAVTMCSILVLLVVALWLGVKLPGVHFLALKADVGAPVPDAGAVTVPVVAEVAAPSVATDDEDESPLQKLVGKEGLAETVLRPSGKVRIEGVTYDAHSEGAWIEHGSRIRVLEARTSEVMVREIKQA